MPGRYDPCFNPDEAVDEYGISVCSSPETGKYDAIIVAVGHREFTNLTTKQLRALGRDRCILYDVKGIYPKHEVDGRI